MSWHPHRAPQLPVAATLHPQLQTHTDRLKKKKTHKELAVSSDEYRQCCELHHQKLVGRTTACPGGPLPVREDHCLLGRLQERCCRFKQHLALELKTSLGRLNSRPKEVSGPSNYKIFPTLNYFCEGHTVENMNIFSTFQPLEARNVHSIADWIATRLGLGPDFVTYSVMML